MTLLNKKTVNPAVNIDIRCDSRENVNDELRAMLIHKSNKDLQQVKLQSIKKTILCKMINHSQKDSKSLNYIIQSNELLLGYGSITEYQNRYGEKEFCIINDLQQLKDKERVANQQERDINSEQADDSEEDFNEELEEEKWRDHEEDTNINEEGDQNNLKHEGLYQLKKKLFSKNLSSNDENKTVESSEKENELEEKNHEDMIEELGKLTKSLKYNTLEFHKQLETADKDIISKTETNLMSNSEKLQILGSKLGKFSRSKLGIYFYLSSLLAMMLGLFLTYLIIKIFPEM